MKTTAGIAALILAAAPQAVVGAATAATTTTSASYIVVLNPGVSPAEHGRAYGVTRSYTYGRALKGYAARFSAQQVERLRADSRVQFVQRDGAVTATAQSTPTGINRANGDGSSAVAGNGSGSVGVDVAVIDTGVDLDHPDLNVYRSGARNCSKGSSADDGNGHGTHVAGTVGARDNANGVVGMAPGARIWPVRVLDNRGSGTFSAIVCGIDYVAAHASEIEVANMSLGGPGRDDGNCGRSNGDAMHRAVCGAVARGVTVVVAAGNDSDNAANHVPASYDEVVTVSALADFNGVPGGGAASTCRSDVDDTFANFSNFGSDVDLIAPGVCIRSTWNGGGYSTISGTSMAAPHVAGAAALYKATHPTAGPGTVKAALQGAGSLSWNSVDDRDGTKERLLDASGF